MCLVELQDCRTSELELWSSGGRGVAELRSWNFGVQGLSPNDTLSDVHSSTASSPRGCEHCDECACIVRCASALGCPSLLHVIDAVGDVEPWAVADDMGVDQRDAV